MALSAASSLSLRALLFGAIERAGLEPGPQHLSGVTPPAVALALSAAARRSPVLVVVPADRDIDPLIADIRFFASTLEGWSAAHAERVVLPCPSLEIDPYREIAPHLDVTSARARALHALATKAARVVVTSVAAIAARVSSVERMRDAAVVLQSDVEVDLATLADRLVDAGFTRADPVDQHGEFCIRGGLVDVFPPGEAQPVRVEFLGDTIETLRRYDAQTQRSIETIDHVLLLPLRDVLPEAGGGAAQGADDVGVEAVDRGGSILDYANDAGARLFVVEHADVIAARRGARCVAGEQLRRGDAAGPARPRARGDRGPLERARRRAGDGDTARSARGRRTRIGRSAPSPARASRGITAASTSGSPSCARRGKPARPRCSSPNRPAGPSARSSCCASTTCWRSRSTPRR